MILKTHCKFNISITILFLVTDTAKTALFCSSFTPPLYYSQQKKKSLQFDDCSFCQIFHYTSYQKELHQDFEHSIRQIHRTTETKQLGKDSQKKI